MLGGGSDAKMRICKTIEIHLRPKPGVLGRPQQLLSILGNWDNHLMLCMKVKVYKTYKPAISLLVEHSKRELATYYSEECTRIFLTV